jgi:hypothetical protein
LLTPIMTRPGPKCTCGGRKKYAGLRRHRGLESGKFQRKLLTATALLEAPSAAVKDAGTWRGNDIAAAATIVARSSRRVHMFAS